MAATCACVVLSTHTYRDGQKVLSRRESREFAVDPTAPGMRDDRQGRRKSPVAGTAASARACVMARSPHIARGRSGTCASEAACAMVGRAVLACLARAFLCPSVRAWRMERREGGRSTTPPACVRACGRACASSDLADSASRDVAQLACAASPRDRAHLGRPPAEGGRAERRVTAMKTHVHAYIRARVVLGSRPDLRDVPRLARARPPRVTELTAQQRTWTRWEGGRGGAPSLQLKQHKCVHRLPGAVFR